MDFKILTLWCLWMILLHKVYGSDNDDAYVETDGDYAGYANYDEPVIASRHFYIQKDTRSIPKKVDTSKCFTQPACPALLHQKFNSIDGTCNNRVDRNRGRTLRSYKRLLPASYADNKGALRTGVNGKLPNTRVVSTAMSGENTISAHLSRFVPWWGQFLIHDIAFTPAVEENDDGSDFKCKCGDTSPDCINIPLPEDDEQTKYDGKTCITLPRSLPVADSSMKHCDPTVRQQMNSLSGFMDLGTVYGNSAHHLDALLEPRSTMGELKARNNHAGLPDQNQIEANVSSVMLCPKEVHKPVGTPCFVAGDIRANENSGLIAVHTVMMKKHNQIARHLKEINPHWGPDLIFKTSKAILTALHQIVTYREFLPALLGPKHMTRYNLNLVYKGYWYGYDSTLDGTIANVFPAAAFRFGHSMVTPVQSRPDPSWTEDQADPLLTSQSFFNTEPITNEEAGGVNSLFRGILRDPAMSVDSNFVRAMRNFLFAEGDKYGDDIFAINLQRGRDHGIPGYNHWRKFCGMPKATSFKEFYELREETRHKLSELYDHVDDVDLYVAGVSEIPVEGGAIGPTFACLIGHQFRDIRNGDRFWHENGGVFQTFTKAQLQALRSTSFPRILCDVIPDMETIQPYPFSVSSEYNERRYCVSYEPLNLEAWRDGVQGPQTEHHDDTQAGEFTMWFPSTKNGITLDPGMALTYLLEYRADQVCSQVMDSETRLINDKLQVRFLCAPGTIKYTDCPAIESEEVYWTEWVNNGQPNDAGDDIETNSRQPICQKPLAVQAITVDGIHASETGDVFAEFSTRMGVICRGMHQVSGFCRDYMVRYLCRRGDEIATPTPTPVPTQAEPTTRWTKWVSTDTPNYNGDLEYLRYAIRQHGVCYKPLKLEARTIDGHTPYQNAGNKIRLVRPDYGFFCFNNDQPYESGKCKDYEVRYLCRVTTTTTSTVPYYIQEKMEHLCKEHDVCCA